MATAWNRENLRLGRFAVLSLLHNYSCELFRYTTFAKRMMKWAVLETREKREIEYSTSPVRWGGFRAAHKCFEEVDCCTIVIKFYVRNNLLIASQYLVLFLIKICEFNMFSSLDLATLSTSAWCRSSTSALPNQSCWLAWWPFVKSEWNTPRCICKRI